MWGLIISVGLFNFVAFKTNKRLTKNQIIHIWAFTIGLQTVTDTYIDLKYHGYWYFTKGIDWESLLAIVFLVPPVNMMFLNWYPSNSLLFKRIIYGICWVVFMIIYELLALLPEPIGYFHYGWWKVQYSFILDPLLLMLILFYYEWICGVEIQSVNK